MAEIMCENTKCRNWREYIRACKLDAVRHDKDGKCLDNTEREYDKIKKV